MRQRSDEFTSLDNRLSRLQMSCMRLFWDNSHGYVLPLREALKLDLRPFDSLARRCYLEYRATLGGFRCTHHGWEVKSRWSETNPWKEKASVQFGSFVRSLQGLSGRFVVGKMNESVRVLKKVS